MTQHMTEAGHTFADSRRGDIVRVATRLFVTKGYNETTMDEIAEPLGISKASLYNYIHSKEDIVFLVLESVEKKWEAVFKSIEENPNLGTPKEFLSKSIHMYIDHVNQVEDEYIFLNHVVVSLDKEGRRKLLASTIRVVEHFQRSIDDGIASGEFTVGNARVMALIIAKCCSDWANNRWFLRRLMTLEGYKALVTEIGLKAIEAK